MIGGRAYSTGTHPGQSLAPYGFVSHMDSPMDKDDILFLLKLIDQGVLTVEPIMGDVYAGDEEYKLNGSTLVFTVFNDWGEWDYLDSVKQGNEIIWEFNGNDELSNYRPENPEKWAKWLG